MISLELGFNSVLWSEWLCNEAELMTCRHRATGVTFTVWLTAPRWLYPAGHGVPTFNPSTWQTEAGRPLEFETSLFYIVSSKAARASYAKRLCLKQQPSQKDGQLYQHTPKAKNSKDLKHIPILIPCRRWYCQMHSWFLSDFMAHIPKSLRFINVSFCKLMRWLTAEASTQLPDGPGHKKDQGRKS